MKTKEAIIDEEFSDDMVNEITGYKLQFVKDAMDEFAKQQSKEFLVWADSNAARDGMQSWSIGVGRTTKVYTTDQLYDLFIETQQNNGAKD